MQLWFHVSYHSVRYTRRSIMLNGLNDVDLVDTGLSLTYICSCKEVRIGNPQFFKSAARVGWSV